jgi:urease accessory protein UreE
MQTHEIKVNKDERIKSIERKKLHQEVDKALDNVNMYSGYGDIILRVHDKKVIKIKPQATKNL